MGGGRFLGPLGPSVATWIIQVGVDLLGDFSEGETDVLAVSKQCAPLLCSHWGHQQQLTYPLCSSGLLDIRKALGVLVRYKDISAK